MICLNRYLTLPILIRDEANDSMIADPQIRLYNYRLLYTIVNFPRTLA